MSKPDPWYERAACKGADPADFDLDGHGAAALMSEKRAKLICNGDPENGIEPCPVRLTCLEDAMANEAASGNNLRWGVFGGLNPDERKKLAKARAKEGDAA